MKRKIMRAVYLKRYNIDLAEAIRSLEVIEKTTPSKLDEITAKLQELFAKGELKTEVQRKIKLEKVVEAVNQYRNNMTGGKVIFLPQEK